MGGASEGDARLCVLFVDDDELVRRSFARALSFTFDITQARDGSEAIAILGTRSFDAVVTDLVMPNVSGDALVAWLEEHDKLLSARVIVLTGGPASAQQATWLKTFEASRVLMKPCALDNLIHAVTRAANRPR